MAVEAAKHIEIYFSTSWWFERGENYKLNVKACRTPHYKHSWTWAKLYLYNPAVFQKKGCNFMVKPDKSPQTISS